MNKHNMIVFDRNFVENKLLEKLEKIGIKLFLGKKLKDIKSSNELVLDNNEKIKGKIIIDASGIACQVGRRIGIDTKLKPEDIGVCIQNIVQGNFEPNIMKFWHLEPYAPLGYAWLFPKNEKIANIGLGVPGGNKQDLEKLLASYISYTTNDNYKIINTFKSCLPQASPINPLVKDNVMIVGDAARLVHPTSGAGIGNAIFSGGLAGIIAARYISNELPSLQIYQDAINYKIKRITKDYNNKDKAIKNEKMYLKIFGRGLSLFQLINKFLPNLSEKAVAINLEKDKKTLESFKGTANLL
jgi:digeranylgeranylglycerophospholipid reductase